MTTGAALRRRLLAWFDRERRDLPWRRTRDPYAIWVAEIMLQQTQVATVLPYFERFLDRFPDAGALAAASEDEVLAAWSGLGYYRRARALHAAAREIVASHGGRLPASPDALRALPGIGRYTAGAIASIAFGCAEPILDGNVRRVLTRIFGIDGRELGTAAEMRRLWEMAADLARGERPGDLNQALMELGALVCTPRAPCCPACPASRLCVARAAGEQERYPAASPRRATERVRVAVGWIVMEGSVLLEAGGLGSPFRGRWDLPAAEVPAPVDAAVALREAFAERHGLELAPGRVIARARHAILHRSLELEVLAGRLGRSCRAEGTLAWGALDRLDEVAISGATRKIARLALSPARAPRSRRPLAAEPS